MQNRFSTAKNSSQRNDQVAVVGIRKVGNGNSSNVEFKISAGTTAAFPYSLFESCEQGRGKVTSFNSGAIL